jgi:hypothetical protein
MLLRISIAFLFLISILTAKAQDLKWIPFKWKGDFASGKYFDKYAIAIPVKVENIPVNFEMQFDLGSVKTVIYGNAIKPYLDAYPDLKNKIDTLKTFLIQGVNNPVFTNMYLKMGSTSFKGIEIGYFKNFGTKMNQDTVRSNTEKHIGTIGPDLFQGKILIIDYPQERIAVCDELPKEYKSATFQPFKGVSEELPEQYRSAVFKPSVDGRIKIPLVINGKSQYLLFDTGSSLFTMMTTKEDALKVAGSKIEDSLTVTSWGKQITYYGVKTNNPIKFGNKGLSDFLVYYDEQETFAGFYKFSKIWGLTGNAFFLKNTVIIDYKNKLFGIL